MSKNTYCILGLAASILTAVAGVVQGLPPEWQPYLLLGGAIGTGVSAWLMKSPIDHQEKP